MFQLFLNVSYMEKDNYKTYCKPTPYYQIFLVMIQKEQEYKNKSLLMKKCNQNCIFMPLAKMQQAKNISKYIYVLIMLNRIETKSISYAISIHKHLVYYSVYVQGKCDCFVSIFMSGSKRKVGIVLLKCLEVALSSKHRRIKQINKKTFTPLKTSQQRLLFISSLW